MPIVLFILQLFTMKTLIYFLVLCMAPTVYGQVAIATNGSLPDPSAMLDIKSTTRGMLTPRMTKSNRLAIANPAQGLIVFQTDDTVGYYYNKTGIANGWTRMGDLELPYSGIIASADKIGFVVQNTQYTAMQGYSSATSGIAYGVWGISASSSGMGVSGRAASATGITTGVLGEAYSDGGRGVYGSATSQTGITYGVRGRVNSHDGFAMYGEGPAQGIVGKATSATGATFGVQGQAESTTGSGVIGEALATTGINYGVYGKTASATGFGVFGINTATSGLATGVYGEAAGLTGYGVYGKGNIGVMGRGESATTFAVGVAGEVFSAATTGKGVYGRAFANSGSATGVYGESYSTTGSGVTGLAVATTGLNFGVRGITSSSDGRAVYAEATSLTGSAVAVWGRTFASSGTGIYGRGNTGIMAESDGETGTGLIVTNSHPSGFTTGVYSTIVSPNGHSGVFSGGRFYVGGNVGIGTLEPEYRLVVLAASTASTGIAAFRNSEGANKVVLRQNTDGSGAVHVYDADNVTSILLRGSGGASYINSGNLGIGTTSPTQMLDVAANARFRVMASTAYAGPVNRTADGTLTIAVSDARLKTSVQPLQNSLDKVLRLQGISFLWKDNPQMGRRIGFVAQDFEKVLPELGFTNPADGYKGINYAEMTAVLTEALKELNARHEQLLLEFKQLKAMVEKMQAEKAVRN
jgi:trimeric autotransporter adhesin